MTVPAVGSTAPPALCTSRAPHLMAPQVLPVPTTLLSPPHHLQCLALLPLPSWCPGTPCHTCTSRQGKGHPHPIPTITAFPPPHPCAWGSWRQHQTQKRGSQPGFGGCAGFKEGTCLAEVGWAGSPFAPPAPCRARHQGSRSPDEASGTLQPRRVPGAGCCPAKPSAPEPGHLAAALTSLPTLRGADGTGAVGLAGTGSCQAPGPGLTAQAGLVLQGWLRAARLQRHAPTMGMPGSMHSAGARWPCTVGLAGYPSAAASLHQGAALREHWLSPTSLGCARGLIPH